MTPPDDDKLARNRFMVINAVRLTGVGMILFGVLVVRGVVGLPQMAGIVLLVLGVLETFLMPTMLARVWNTNDRNPPRGPGSR